MLGRRRRTRAGYRDAARRQPSQSYLALLLRALLCRYGLDQMLADIQAALEELSPGSQWRPSAQLLEGICYLLAGQADRADPVLAHAAEVATDAGALPRGRDRPGRALAGGHGLAGL